MRETHNHEALHKHVPRHPAGSARPGRRILAFRFIIHHHTDRLVPVMPTGVSTF